MYLNTFRRGEIFILHTFVQCTYTGKSMHTFTRKSVAGSAASLPLSLFCIYFFQSLLFRISIVFDPEFCTSYIRFKKQFKHIPTV